MRFVLLLVSTAAAWGCSCAGWPTAKQAWQSSASVFVGSVARTDPDGNAPGASMLPQDVFVTVVEPFKGVEKDQTVRLRQNADSCSLRFKPGERVLFYLHPENNSRFSSVSGCWRSPSLETAADDLLFLRKLPFSARGNRLSGEVEVYEQSGPDGFRRVGTLPGVKVTATPKGGPPVTTVTNGDGVYEIYNLPPASYKVDVEIPKGLKLRLPMIYGIASREGQQSVTLTANSSAGVSFLLMADTRVSGRVLDPDGAPMDEVCLDLVALSEPVQQMARLSDCTEDGGRFKIEMMPLGSYRLIANRRGTPSASEPFSTVYYPGTTDVAKAGVIHVTSARSFVDNLDLRIPKLADRAVLSGKVQFLDGGPVPEASVRFVPNGEAAERAKTRPDGTFELRTLAGKKGELEAEILLTRSVAERCPQFGVKFNPQGYDPYIKASRLEVTTGSSTSALLLTLPVKSCPAWPRRE